MSGVRERSFVMSVVRKLSSGTLPTQNLLIGTSVVSLVLPPGCLAVHSNSDLHFSFGCGRMSGDTVKNNFILFIQ